MRFLELRLRAGSNAASLDFSVCLRLHCTLPFCSSALLLAPDWIPIPLPAGRLAARWLTAVCSDQAPRRGAWPRHCPAAKCKHAGKQTAKERKNSKANNLRSLSRSLSLTLTHSLAPSPSRPQKTPSRSLDSSRGLSALPAAKERSYEHRWLCKCSTPQSESSTTSSTALQHRLPLSLPPRSHRPHHLPPPPPPLLLPSMTRCTKNANSGSSPIAPVRASALSPQQDP